MIFLYLFGILCGILYSLILKRTRFRGEPVPFVMELPNYRLPSPKSVGQLIWEKARDFIQRAFTIIFVATVVIWFLQTFDTRLNVAANIESADAIAAAKADPAVAEAIAGKTIAKEIYVRGRLVNIAVKG